MESEAAFATGGGALAVREGATENLDGTQDGRKTWHAIPAMEGTVSEVAHFAQNDNNDSLEGISIVPKTGKVIYFFDFATMMAHGRRLLKESAGKFRRVSNAENVAFSADGQNILVVTDDGKDSRLLTYGINFLS